MINRAPLWDAPGLLSRVTTYLTTNVAETRENHPFKELQYRYFDENSDILMKHVLNAIYNLK